MRSTATCLNMFQILQIALQLAVSFSVIGAIKDTDDLLNNANEALLNIINDYLKFEKGIWRRYKMIFDDRKKNNTNLRKL